MSQDKPSLVLLHGWAINSAVWDPLLPDLEKHFEVAVQDLPGYGSTAPLRLSTAASLSQSSVGNQQLAAHVDWLLDVLPERSIVVAWSLAATLALAAAARSPERFLGLQLISATPRFLDADDWDHGLQRSALEGLSDQFERSFTRGLQKFLLLQMHRGEIAAVGLKARVRELMERLAVQGEPSSATLNAGLLILSETDLRESLGGIKVRTQVIAGTADRVVPLAASNELAKQLPDSEFVGLDAGHMPFLDCPEAYLRQLVEFAGRLK